MNGKHPRSDWSKRVMQQNTEMNNRDIQKVDWHTLNEFPTLLAQYNTCVCSTCLSRNFTQCPVSIMYLFIAPCHQIFELTGRTDTSELIRLSLVVEFVLFSFLVTYFYFHVCILCSISIYLAKACASLCMCPSFSFSNLCMFFLSLSMHSLTELGHCPVRLQRLCLSLCYLLISLYVCPSSMSHSPSKSLSK